MTFLPSLGTMPQIEDALQQVQGVAAAILGQTYNVLRLGNNASGSIFDEDPIATNFPLSPLKASKKSIENDTFNLLVFIGTCDNRTLQLGDLLVETGFEAEAGNAWGGSSAWGGAGAEWGGGTADVFAFAQRRPMHESLFVRCESQISITRPQPHGGQSGQQPVSGWVDAPGHMGIDKAREWPLVLTDGSYDFVPPSTPNVIPAAVPAGLTQLQRLSDARDPDIPVTLYRERFMAYIPLLPGVQLTELDRINFPNEDRYQLASLYTSEQTGLAGYILICEKLSV
jgi:hypothetical protein